MPKDISRRRLLLTAGGVAGMVVLAVPAGSAAQSPGPRPSPRNSVPGDPEWNLPGGRPQAGRPTGAYVAYVALTGGRTVATVDVTTHRIVANDIPADAAQGVAATPDGAKLYIAETGRFEVLVVDPATGSARSLRVGPFPRSVAVSPDGTKVYAAVTGGDTGKGGSDALAVIDARSDRVVRSVRVGTAPRQVVFAADGTRAYVTYDSGIAVLDARKDRVLRRVRDASGPQGVAVDAAGRTLYVTEPRAGTVSVIDAAGGRVRGRITVGDEPWGIAVTPDGAKAYVSRMNADAVAVIDTASRRIRRTIAVGRLPSPVVITPDGAEAWVGNVMSGTVSAIRTASDAVVATIAGGSDGRRLGVAPLGIAFAGNPGAPPPAARRPAKAGPTLGPQDPPARAARRRREPLGACVPRPDAPPVPPDVFARVVAEGVSPGYLRGDGEDTGPWVIPIDGLPIGGMRAGTAVEDVAEHEEEAEDAATEDDDATSLLAAVPGAVIAALPSGPDVIGEPRPEY